MPRPQSSRRERIAAIAATADYNPEEAAVAQAMLDSMPRNLDAIAEDIRGAVGRGHEAQFAVGRLLSEARSRFPGASGDKEYGRWLTAQDFGFGTSQAYRLRWAAEHESEVRGYLTSRASRTGKGPGPEVGVAGAYVALNRKPKPITIDVGPTEPVDPAYAALRAARFAVVGTVDAPTNAFTAMHVDDLTASAGYLRDLVAAYQEARNAR